MLAAWRPSTGARPGSARATRSSVDLELDEAPRDGRRPRRLRGRPGRDPAARATFDGLSNSNKKWHVLEHRGRQVARDAPAPDRQVDPRLLREGRAPIKAEASGSARSSPRAGPASTTAGSRSTPGGGRPRSPSRPSGSASSRSGCSTTSTPSPGRPTRSPSSRSPRCPPWPPLTERVRLGHIVICTAFRNPALTAKMISTMDTISGGRMELGIGAGWKRDEWLAYGYGFPETKDRLARLGDDLEVITRMLAGDRHEHATYRGRRTRRCATRSTCPSPSSGRACRSWSAATAPT